MDFGRRFVRGGQHFDESYPAPHHPVSTDPNYTFPMSEAMRLVVEDLGNRPYADAYQDQAHRHEEVLASRDGRQALGYILLVEHPPVVTISRRASSKDHLLATPALLASRGVEVCETDRGGDITYHGPGQLVAYPILDLNRLKLGIHAYMRLLEETVIRTLAAYAIAGQRDTTATGVWVDRAGTLAKVAAMGVRVRRWVSMHGLALNVAPRMEDFQLIVPCGLAGRPVTCMRDLLGSAPDMASVKATLVSELTGLIREAERAADAKVADAKNEATPLT
ncbi:MAG: lipoyl(octanoyl) transferase LipB [Tepidisphaera sp.]|nr:lipoyl(octanoyl) transferase LipB [Tepidisphaera sp.]